MNNYSLPQDVLNGAGDVNGLPFSRFMQRMLQEGVAVCGVGRANLPLIEWLLARGVPRITARDRGPLSPRLATFGERVRPITGEGYLQNLTEGVIVRTPSLRPDTPALCEAVARGAILTSEVALFTALCRARLLALTGSDGKTTTALLTGAMLRAAGHRTFVGGNTGTPLLPYAALMRRGDFAVAELSSFQLADLTPHPLRCAVTNLSENHLNWHRSMAEYIEAKSHILAGVAVLNADCPETLAMAAGRDALLFSLTKTPRDPAVGGRPLIYRAGGEVLLEDGGTHRLFAEAELRLPGEYNLANAMTAAGLALPFVPPEAMQSALRAFRGAPHRMAYVASPGGIACYDSSIDTTPTRTAATLSAFPGRAVVIVGGRNKGLSFAPLAEALFSHAEAVVVTGEAREEILAALAAYPAGGRRLPIFCEPRFAAAVERALTTAKRGGAVILSPACTSYDAFPDFTVRGRTFAAICRDRL